MKMSKAQGKERKEIMAEIYFQKNKKIMVGYISTKIEAIEKNHETS